MMDVSSLTQALPSDGLSILSVVILALPFLSFLTITSLKPTLYKKADLVSIAFLLTSFLLSVFVLWQVWGQEEHHLRLNWFSFYTSSGVKQFTLGILLDNEASIMLVIVSLISLLVHLFSMDYMYEDKHYARYFSYLGFFTFSMFGLVLSDNLLQLFVFWELVGFSSYLLIGFWFQRSSATRASHKAFLVNKFGDIGFLVGIFILYYMFETLDFEAIKYLMSKSSVENGEWILNVVNAGSEHINQLPSYWIPFFGIGLFLAAVAKSAQFPLQIWLPDAMKGPTPVSALIHAATMVAAGIYLLVRVFPILHVDVLFIITCVGAITAFMASLSAIFQNDIKKVLAYSTSSQLGYMVMGIGVGAYDAAFFHMVTHAFFKAGLFLSVGVIIKSLHSLETRLYENGHTVHVDIQDMRYMGGLRKHLPFVFLSYVICSAALIGIPFFSGFLSKDAILLSSLTWANHYSSQGHLFVYIIPFLGFVSVMFTAIYTFRQILLVFFGSYRLPKALKLESPISDFIQQPNLKHKIPLVILSILSLAFAFSYNPFSIDVSWVYSKFETYQYLIPSKSYSWFLEPLVLTNSESSHFYTIIFSLIFISLGLLIAFLKYNPSSTYVQSYLDKSKKRIRYQNFFRENWKMDYFFKTMIVNPVLCLAHCTHRFDMKVLDSSIVQLKNGVLYLSKLSKLFDSQILNKFYDLMGKSTVVLGHIMLFIETYVVDGIVTVSYRLTLFFGQKFKEMQGRDVQFYLSRMLTVLLVLIGLYFIFFIL